MKFRFVIIFLFSFLVSPLYAASFDCKKAITEIEKAICADPQLSALDELIAISYSVARSISLDKDSLRNTQKNWLLERDKVSGKVDTFPLYPNGNLYAFMLDRFRFLIRKSIGSNYEDILNLLSKSASIEFEVENSKRVALLTQSNPYHGSYRNALFFDADNKLVKVFIGEVYGFDGACADSFSFFEDTNTRTTSLAYTMSCGVNGRHGWEEITYIMAPRCIQLQNIERSSGHAYSSTVGSWKLNDDLKICLEEQNYKLSVDGLVSFKSDEAVGFVSIDEWLVFLTDYWLYPPVKSAQAEVAGCGTASKMFTQYAVSSVRYSDIIGEYIKNKTVYDLFLPLIKTVDGDGSVKKWVAKLLTFYDSEEKQWDIRLKKEGSCYVSFIQGDFHRTSPFFPSGFWERRKIDGTTDQTLEILRKLQEILAD